ncbi:MAG: protein-L-isoaspartate O-methyltransferase [Gammaproteobacteria bacterium]|nr:protein-L-isoaspartate O-methyltransferase [Gammaproteobacteria bacterium]MDH3464975.1 protein-L-isoaspartate O-methyltransferase [Gammaproteobacteria bacterium]
MDIELARFNMIEQQIRPWEVLDSRVLELLHVVHRENFVPQSYRQMAFADMNIPLGDGEVMMQPKTEGRLLQELAPRKTDTVLEIGTGSGHLTALLAALSKHVYSVEINPRLYASAQKTLADNGVENITLEMGDAAQGWNKHEPYNAIIVTGSLPMLPPGLQQSLAPDGRLVVIVGQQPIMEALLIERIGDTGWNTRSLFDTSLPPLVNAEAPPAFVF